MVGGQGVVGGLGVVRGLGVMGWSSKLSRGGGSRVGWVHGWWGSWGGGGLGVVRV